MITSDAIAAEVDAAAADYERCLRRRELSESDVQEEMRLFRKYVTIAFEGAAAELDEWLRAGRWLQ